MIRFTLLVAALLWANGLAHSQSITSIIDDPLYQEANEIVIFDHTEFVAQSIYKAREKRHYKVYIKDAESAALSEVELHYSQFVSVESARAEVYHPNGKKIKTIKFNDFRDYSTKGGSMADDSRVKHYQLSDYNHPVVLEVTYELSYSGSMFFPRWIPQFEGQGVELATFTVTSQYPDAFRHKSIGVEAHETQLEQGKKVTWKVEKRKPYIFQAYSYRIEDYAPVVYTAPNKFQMEGYEGDLSSWGTFGQWNQSLSKGRNTLGQEAIQEIKRQMPTGLDDLEKAKWIYSYLQANTRYVSIQLGIGGYQPFESGFVHDKKYGDCKALSFYTKSLLEAFGIKAYYTLINAGSYASQVYEDFPMSHFNHAILTLPMEQDTVWLECTSQTSPFGYMGKFTSDRNALMITDDGAVLVHTKSYSEEDNMQQTVTQIDLQKDGTGQVRLQRTYHGLELGNDYFQYAVQEGAEEQRKWFYDQHQWGSLSLQELELAQPTNEVVPVGKMEAALEMHDICSQSGDRLFLSPFTFTNIQGFKLVQSERDIPVEIRYPFSQLDTVEVNFPEGFYPESEPRSIDIDHEYGAYRVQTEKTGEYQYRIIRYFSLKKGRYQGEAYQSFRAFIKDVRKKDRRKLVMINKT